jgi:hypothetical protein
LHYLWYNRPIQFINYKVVYAEDVREDEILKNRRLVISFGFMACLAIITLTITLVIVLGLRDKYDECKHSMDDITISMYCRCNGRADPYLDYFGEKYPGLYNRYWKLRNNLLSKRWIADAVFADGVQWNMTDDSCQDENMALIAMAVLGERHDVNHGIFQSNASTMLEMKLGDQLFSIMMIFMSLGGDHWNNNVNWFANTDVCSWAGIE